MLIKISNRIINLNRIAFAQLDEEGTEKTLIILLTSGPKQEPSIKYTIDDAGHKVAYSDEPTPLNMCFYGDEAVRIWEKLSQAAEDWTGDDASNWQPINKRRYNGHAAT